MASITSRTPCGGLSMVFIALKINFQNYFIYFTNFLTNHQLHDISCGFRVCRADTASDKEGIANSSCSSHSSLIA